MKNYYLLGTALSALLLTACSTQGPVTTVAAEDSKIPGYIDDGGWVTNIPGRAQTHRVVLAACPDAPQVVTHVHDHDQVGVQPHKHNGCFACPGQ
ncbi:MAG: hypothetical protein R3E89_19170 [Thiolinea sp.]